MYEIEGNMCYVSLRSPTGIEANTAIVSSLNLHARYLQRTLLMYPIISVNFYQTWFNYSFLP